MKFENVSDYEKYIVLAKQVVTNVGDAKWNDKTSAVLVVANQIGLKI